MITARLAFRGPEAAKTAAALEPDNIKGISMREENGTLIVEFRALKIGTILSTADDILMNIKIAEEALASLEGL